MSDKPERAQERLAFLLSFVPYLIDRGSVSVAEAARDFALDEADIRDAVRLISVSGVPGNSRQYLPDDLFDIDWDAFEEDDQVILTHRIALEDSPRFSAREAAALIAGLQYLSALPENADRDALASLTAKLSRGASSSPSQVAVAAAETDAAVGQLRTAIERGVQVEFAYRNARGEHEHRTADPLRLESLDQDWYLRAWCHGRQAVRLFRLDRMGPVTSTDRPATGRATESVLPQSLFEGSAEDLVVTVQIARSALPLIADYLTGPVPGGSGDGAVRTRLRVAHYHGLKRLACRLGGILTVVSPAAARAAVAEWADAGARQYAEDH